MMHAQISDQAKIDAWLATNKPSRKPNWGDLQPVYDSLIAKGHRVALLEVWSQKRNEFRDRARLYELDGQLVSKKDLVAASKGARLTDNPGPLNPEIAAKRVLEALQWIAASGVGLGYGESSTRQGSGWYTIGHMTAAEAHAGLAELVRTGKISDVKTRKNRLISIKICATGKVLVAK